MFKAQRSIQVKPQGETDQCSQILNKNIKHSPVISQFANKYSTFFYNCQNVDKKEFQQQLNFNNIFIKRNSQHSITQFYILSIHQTQSKQVFEIKVSLHPFETTVLVLVNQNKAQLKNYTFFAKGGFGQIFKSYDIISQQVYLIKSINIKQQNWKNQFLSVLREYTFNLIMSALRIGPKIQKKIGFDLVIYQNCIQFALEFCSNQTIDNVGIKQLKQNLKIMHSFNILHQDIKPENIFYSNKFKRWVFIDFGFSKIVKQSLGYKTFLRQYSGTIEYSSTQMKRCIIEPGFVDLYFNDVHALQRSFQSQFFNHVKKLKRFNQKQISHENLTFNNKFHQESVNILKYYLLLQNNTLIEILSHTLNQQVQNQLVVFLYSIFPTKFLKKVYFQRLKKNLIVNQSIRKSIQNKFINLTIWSENQYKNSKFNRCFSIHQTQLKSFSFNSQEFQQRKQIKRQKNYKYYLTNETFFNQIQKQEFYSLSFSYITFRKNEFNASLQSKYEVALFMIKMCQLNINTFLQYRIPHQQLKAIITCLQFMMNQCQKLPYCNISKQLYPSLCVQMAFINCWIFCPNNKINYFTKWYRTAFKMNQQNFYQMLNSVITINEGNKYLNQKDSPYICEFSQKKIMYDSLIDVWQDNEYLLKHLEDKNLILEIKKMIGHLYRNSQIDQIDYQKIRHAVENQANLNVKLKQQLVHKIKLIRQQNIQEQNYKGHNLSKFLKIGQYVQNFQQLTPEHFILLERFQTQSLNARQLCNKIKNIINCEIISQQYLRTYLRQNKFSFQNIQKDLQLAQCEVDQIQQSFSFNAFHLRKITIAICLTLKKQEYFSKKGPNLAIQTKFKLYLKKLFNKLRKIWQLKFEYLMVKQIAETNHFNHIVAKTSFFLQFGVITKIFCTESADQIIQYFKRVLIRVKQYFNEFPEEMKQIQILSYEFEYFLNTELMKLTNYQVLFLLHNQLQTKDIKLDSFQTSNVIKYKMFRFIEHYFLVQIDYKNGIINLSLEQNKKRKQLQILYLKIIRTLISYWKDKRQKVFLQNSQYFLKSMIALLTYQYEHQNYDTLIETIYALSQYINKYQELTINNIITVLICLTGFNSIKPDFVKYFLNTQQLKQKVFANPYWWFCVAYISKWCKLKNQQILSKLCHSLKYLNHTAKIQMLRMISVQIIELQYQKLTTQKPFNKLKINKKFTLIARRYKKYIFEQDQKLFNFKIKVKKKSDKKDNLKYGKQILIKIQQKISKINKNFELED